MVVFVFWSWWLGANDIGGCLFFKIFNSPEGRKDVPQFEATLLVVWYENRCFEVCDQVLELSTSEV